MWTITGADETPAEIAAWRREMRLRRRAPGNEIGGIVHAPPLLSQSRYLAIHLDTVKVFSTGLQLRFEVLTRPIPPTGSAQSRSAPLWADSAREGGMLIGVKLLDGRTAINIDDERRRQPTNDDELVLARTGFSGSEEAASVQYLLSPMPTAQSVTVVVAWQQHGVPQTATVIEAAEIAAGASRLVTLWPADEDLDWFGAGSST